MKPPGPALIVALIASLHGAAGVALAAAAAHVESSALLQTASQMLVTHAAAGLALAALAARLDRAGALLAASLALQAGVTLFSADLAARVFGSGRLFPYAAPVGGSLTMLSWLGLAVWAAVELTRREGKAPPEGR